MNERNQGSSEGRNTNQSPQDYFKEQAELHKQSQSAPRPPQQPASKPRQYSQQHPQRSSAQYPTPRPDEYRAPNPKAPTAESVAPPSAERKRRHMSKRARILAGAAIVLVAGAGFGYATDTAGIRTSISNNLDQAQASTDGLKVNGAIEKMGTKSLLPTECDKSDAVTIVMTVNGYFPLDPLVSSTENPTPAPALPYMLKENINTFQTKEEQDDFAKNVTVEGFQRSTLNKLKLGIAICQLGESAITTKGDELTVDRSKLTLVVKDPFSLFEIGTVKPVLQTNGPIDVTLDPSKFEYMSQPNAANLHVGKNGDPVNDAAVDTLTAAMKSPRQSQVLFETMKAKAVQEIDAVVDGSDKVSYPSGDMKNLQDVASAALVEQITGKTMEEMKDTTTWIGDFAVQTVIQEDPASKTPITNADPTTGANALIGLDPSQDFHLTDAKIEFGKIERPEPISSPLPSSTETPAPTETPTP